MYFCTTTNPEKIRSFMINRELIRLKIVQLVYAFYQNEGKTLDVAEKELIFSLDKAYDLYCHLLGLLVDLQKMAERKNEARIERDKRLKQESTGIFPDEKMASNQFLLQLRANTALLQYREKQGDFWEEEDAFVRKLYKSFTESDIFQLYLEKEDFSFEADRELVRKLYKYLVCNNEDLDAVLEERSLYWNDDKEIIDSFVLKTIKRFTPESDESQPLLPEYTSEDDRNYAVSLFREALTRSDEVRELIKQGTKNWDFSRLAFMDVIIMQIALTEILTFPSIPLSVSFNEYLDIAKVYSTPRSSSYINGTMDNIVKQLKSEGKLLK